VIRGAHCYDYEAAVLFNFHAGELWRRFTTYLPRHLARLAGVTGKRLRAELLIIALAAKAVRLDMPGSGPRVRLGFGLELDTRPVWREDFAATAHADCTRAGYTASDLAMSQFLVSGRSAVRFRSPAPRSTTVLRQ
jgi:hypothetical protein